MYIVHRPRFFHISFKFLVARSDAKFAYFLKGTRDYHFVESRLSSDQALKHPRAITLLITRYTGVRYADDNMPVLVPGMWFQNRTYPLLPGMY